MDVLFDEHLFMAVRAVVYLLGGVAAAGECSPHVLLEFTSTRDVIFIEVPIIIIHCAHFVGAALFCAHLWEGPFAV